MLEPGSNELLTYLHRSTCSRQWETLPHDGGTGTAEGPGGRHQRLQHNRAPFTLQQQGIPFRVFSPRDIGYDFYGDNLFTSESEVINQQERVQRFLQASLRGGAMPWIIPRR